MLNRIHHPLYVKCRESPTACIIDCHSVKSAKKGVSGHSAAARLVHSAASFLLTLFADGGDQGAVPSRNEAGLQPD
jgi:hypothetical protein